MTSQASLESDLAHVVPCQKSVGQHVAACAADAGRIEAFQFRVRDAGLHGRNSARLRPQFADGICRAPVIENIRVRLNDHGAVESEFALDKSIGGSRSLRGRNGPRGVDRITIVVHVHVAVARS